MKSIPIIILFSFFTFISRGECQIILNQGDSYDFTFSTMNNNSGTSFAWPVSVYVGYENDLLNDGESIQIELFENTLVDSPWQTTVHSQSGFLSSVNSIIFSNSESNWGDLSGAVRITMLTGSVEIIGLSIQRNIATDKYIVSASIPEPSTYLLLTISSVICFLLTKRKPILAGN